MNKIFKSIWNSATSSWVAVAENAKAHGKSNVTVAAVAVQSRFAVAPSFTKLAAIGLISSLFGYANTAYAACTLVSGTWECTGVTTASVIAEDANYSGGGQHGIGLYYGNVSIHNQAGATIQSAAGSSGVGDGITNSNTWSQYTTSFNLVNDGSIISTQDMGVQGGLANATSWTAVNNGLVQGRTMGLAAGSNGLQTITNSATGRIVGGMGGYILAASH